MRAPAHDRLLRFVGSSTSDRARAGAGTGFVILASAFLLSGFSALVYQTAWQRMLGLFAGSDSVATTLVVGGFLFGLGVGSLVGAAVADRLSPRGTLLLFAACEAGIGVCALLSPWVSYDLLATQMAARADALPVVIGLTMGALFVPTVLMGMSLPLLGRAIAGGLERAPTRIGLLYGVNTLGGAFGCLVAGFVLIGILGYGDTVRLAACLNLAVAGVAAVLALGREGAGPSFTGTVRARTASGAVLVRWAVLVFVAGFLTISLEIVWFRVLGALMRSDSHAFALILGLFLLGDGIGVVLGALLVRRIASPLRVFLLLQGVITIYALAAMVAVYAGHVWFGAADLLIQAPPGGQSLGRTILRFAGFAALASALVVPPGVALGMSFPLAQKAVQLEPTLIGWRLGMVQLSNILGNTAGAVLTGLVLLPLFGTTGVLRIAGTTGLVCLVLLLSLRAARPGPDAPVRSRHRPAVAGLALAAASLTVFFPINSLFWARLHGTLSWPDTIVSEDRAAVTVLAPTARGQALYVGGAWQAAIDPFLDVQGALGIVGPIVHPDPRSVLLIGYGAGGTLYASGIPDGSAHIRVVEIAESVIDTMAEFAARSQLEPFPGLFEDGRIERVIADGRRHLVTSDELFDVVIAETNVPNRAGAGLLFSHEFFEQIRAKLAPGGICVQWLPNERTLSTFVDVFPYVVRVNRVLLGSEQPISFDLDELRREIPRYRDALTGAGWSPEALVQWFEAGPVELWLPDDEAPPGTLNTDLHPRDEFYLSSRLWEWL